MKKNITVVIGDNIQKNIDILSKVINADEEVEMIGSATDGITLEEIIQEKKPDVVILDLLLSKLDGLGVIEKIRNSSMKNQPIFIVTSVIDQEMIIQAAFSFGASYYMLKPFDNALLLKRIKTMKKGIKMTKHGRTELIEHTITCSLESDITKTIHEIGIPAHIKGYQYIRTGLTMAIESPNILDSITKLFYPAIARSFATTPTRVERSIRHAIEVAWARGNTDVLDEVFGFTTNSSKGKPTNSEFICLISDKIRLERKEAV